MLPSRDQGKRYAFELPPLIIALGEMQIKQPCIEIHNLWPVINVNLNENSLNYLEFGNPSLVSCGLDSQKPKLQMG